MMKLTRQERDQRRFKEYEQFWRKVLMDVLEWPEHRFAQLVSRRKATLRRQGGTSFFDISPSHHISSEIVPKRLEQKLSGKKAVFIRLGLMEAICGEIKPNEAVMRTYGLLGALELAEYQTVCNPNFNIHASRLRYADRVKQLEGLVLSTAQDDERAFGKYEMFWRRVLVGVLEWEKKNYKQFVSRQRSELREWGSDEYFREPPEEIVLPYLLPGSLKGSVVGVDAVRMRYRLMCAIAGSSSTYEAVCADRFDIASARRRYLKVLRKEETRLKRQLAGP